MCQTAAWMKYGEIILYGISQMEVFKPEMQWPWHKGIVVVVWKPLKMVWAEG